MRKLKNLLTATFALLFFLGGFYQSRANTAGEKEPEVMEYCIIRPENYFFLSGLGTPEPSEIKYVVEIGGSIHYTEGLGKTTYLQSKAKYYANKEGKTYYFGTATQAMNELAKQGWRLVTAFGTAGPSVQVMPNHLHSEFYVMEKPCKTR